MTERRGFTLVELLVGMVLLTLVGAVTYGVLLNMQRVSRRQTEQSQLQDNVRSGVTILPAELREIGYDDFAGTDLIDIQTNSIQFRAMRGVAFTCDFGTAGISVYRTGHSLYRTPVASDRLLYFLEVQQSVALDDEWIPLSISAVNATTATCPGSVPAIALTLTPGSQGVFNTYLASTFLGGPVRFYEEMQIGLYEADGRSWLGARSVSNNEPYQPVLGPLADGNGVEFTYYNAAGNPVPISGNPNTIRTIEIKLRGRSDQAVKVGPGAAEIVNLDLTTRVALRNTLRP